ncbi:MAG: serine hydrolase domain-containing protein [Janthinobacterium lividum]
MLHRFLLYVGLLGLLAGPAAAQTFNTAKLDSLLTGLAATKRMMGSVALTHDGQVVYSQAFGAAQLTPPVAATPATHYRIGSITKVFTTVMIFQLIEEKKLTLSTPLATFFPQLPNAKTITIDQLLSHRSGLHSFTSDPAYESYLAQPKTQAELLAIIAQTTPDFAPDTKAAYSNSNFVVLGYIVEKLTRQPYAQALQQRIATKAGLKDTYYGGKIGSRPQEAFSYEPAAGSWKPATETDLSIPGGAGAVVSTPTDLDRFLTALFGGKLVAASSLAAMQTMRDHFGRGLFAMPFGTQPGYGHTGGIDGFTSQATYFPADKLALAVCSNGGSYSTNDVGLAALSIYYGRPYHLPNLAPSTFVPAAADLARYAGTYASPQFPLKITMTPEGTTLRSQATGQDSFLLDPVSPGIFTFDSAHIRIEFDPAKPTLTLKQGAGSYVFTKE